MILDAITQWTIINKTPAIIEVIAAFRHNIGLAGADVACPGLMASGAFAPNGSVIKNTHHHNKIYTTSPDTNPM